MNDPIAVSTYLVPSTRVLQLAANSSGTLTNTNYPLAAPASTERVTELRWVKLTYQEVLVSHMVHDVYQIIFSVIIHWTKEDTPWLLKVPPTLGWSMCIDCVMCLCLHWRAD